VYIKSGKLHLLCALALTGGSWTFGSDFYVAPEGKNTNAGTEEAPFATLERARDEIRARKGKGQLQGFTTVWVRRGVYRLSQGLVLSSEDSGTSDTPIVWRAFPGEEVRLTGSVVIPEENFSQVRQETTLHRLTPVARGQVYQVDLKIPGMGKIADYPDVYRGAPKVPELFADGQRLNVARWPNQGWATIAGIVSGGAIPRNGDTAGQPAIFTYSGSRPAGWNSATGVWLQGFWCYDWYEESIRVQSIDTVTNRIVLSKPANYGLRAGNPAPRRFRAINLLEELDEAGEYFIDSQKNLLYVWPPRAMAGGSRYELSILPEPLIALKNAAYVTIRGFILDGGLGNGIELSGGQKNRIVKCEIRNFRMMGVKVDGGDQHFVMECKIHDTGAGGVMLNGGDRRTLTPAGHRVESSAIWRFSCLQLTYAGAIDLRGVGNLAVRNHIYEAPHLAISLTGNDHVVEFNDVHDVCTATDDAGALYKGRDPSGRGNVIRYNFWHDIGSRMGHGTAAIYFDDGDGGDLVLGNIFLRCGSAGGGAFGAIFANGGHDIRAENNIFIDCEQALGSSPWNFAQWQSLLAEGSKFGWQAKLFRDVDITKEPYLSRYPELRGLTENDHSRVRINHARLNLIIACKSASSGNWEVPPDLNWITDQDPGFIDAAAGNYDLKPGAAAFTRLPGFRPTPSTMKSKVGVPDGR
jgi:hypothetical protein